MRHFAITPAILPFTALIISLALFLQTGCGSSKINTNSTITPFPNPSNGSNGNPTNGTPSPNPNPNSTPNPSSGLPDGVTSTPGQRKITLKIHWPEQSQSVTKHFPSQARTVKIESVSYNVEQSEKPVILTRPANGNESTFVWTLEREIDQDIDVSFTITTHLNDTAEDGNQSWGRVYFHLAPNQSGQRDIVSADLQASIETLEIIPVPSFDRANPTYTIQAYTYSSGRTYDGKPYLLLTDPSEWRWSIDNNTDFRLDVKGLEARVTPLREAATRINATHLPSGRKANPYIIPFANSKTTIEDLHIIEPILQISPDEQTLYGRNLQNKQPHKWTKQTGLVPMETGFNLLPYNYITQDFSPSGAFWGTFDEKGKTIFIKYLDQKDVEVLENPENAWGPHIYSSKPVLSEDYKTLFSLIIVSQPRGEGFKYFRWAKDTGWEDISPNLSVGYNRGYGTPLQSLDSSTLVTSLVGSNNSPDTYYRWTRVKNWEPISASVLPTPTVTDTRYQPIPNIDGFINDIESRGAFDRSRNTLTFAYLSADRKTAVITFFKNFFEYKTLRLSSEHPFIALPTRVYRYDNQWP
jgi:hypothetical protein